jgi:hypothetical protein
MWMPCSSVERAGMLAAASIVISNTSIFSSWMQRVIDEFAVSSAHNLSDQGANRRAWIGQAACFMATGCPEDVTREAWGSATEEQRYLANKSADEAIARWESEYENENFAVDRKVGSQGLLGWNS